MKELGVLAPISTLPGHQGIGDFGRVAYEFIDLIKKNDIRTWQILPLNPVGYGNSPYQPYSSYAGDEIYISIDKLVDLQLLPKKNLEVINQSSCVDFQNARKIKNKYLVEAFKQLKNHHHLNDEFIKFVNDFDWVKKYATFITLKKKNNLACWLEWPLEQKNWIENQKLDLTKEQSKIEYEMFVQFIFFKQWFELKDYANQNGVQIIGDIPIYVGIDSADVWENKKTFLLDDKSHPTFIAGVPPDYFSKTGQRWGNPLYDWDYLEKTHFKFWIDRLNWSHKMYDIIRIDHFRAFDTYWKIPATCPTAIEGEWIEAPGYALFDEIFKQIPDIQIVAEDLGDLRDEVLQLRDHYDLSGMKIIQFELDTNETNNDFEAKENTIVYTGTHDNQTLNGWINCLKPSELKVINKQFENYQDDSLCKKIIHYSMDSLANLVILPIQDILQLGDQARLNTPGTIGHPNWSWKLEGYQDLKLALKSIHELMIETNRVKR